MVEQKDCSINPNSSIQTPLEKQVAVIQSKLNEQEELRKIADQKADETMSELRTEHQALAFNAGLTTEEYDALLDTYTAHDSQAILHLLTANKATTIEDAASMIDHHPIEIHIDQENTALNVPSKWWSSYWGGRLFHKEDRYLHPRHHIGKRVVGAMARRFFHKQPGK